MIINPYLNFPGNTEEAFAFYKSVFGSEYTMMSRFSDAPDSYGDPVPEERNRVMHVSFPVGEKNELMGSDTPVAMDEQYVVGNNISLSLQTDSREQTEELFNKLSDGGTVLMPLEDTFWNAYFGMCVDKFGVQWMVNFDHENAEV